MSSPDIPLHYEGKQVGWCRFVPGDDGSAWIETDIFEDAAVPPEALGRISFDLSDSEDVSANFFVDRKNYTPLNEEEEYFYPPYDN